MKLRASLFEAETANEEAPEFEFQQTLAKVCCSSILEVAHRELCVTELRITVLLMSPLEEPV